MEDSSEPIQGFKSIKYKDLLIYFNNECYGSGYTGAQVTLLPYENTHVVIKKFKDIKKGIEELIYSIIGLKNNRKCKDLKIVRICDAVLCPENCLSIIMEPAQKYPLRHYLSTDLAMDVVKAGAEYASIFHMAHYRSLENRKGQTSNVTDKKYLKYASRFFHTLDHAQDNPEEDKPKVELFPCSVGPPLIDCAFSRSDTIVRWLSEEEQQAFIYLKKIICTKFEENCREIYRLLKSPIEEWTYFPLGFTYGDFHGDNLFYTDDNDLIQGDNRISKDSFQRITGIDPQSMMATWDGVGVGAEDVGRMEGWLEENSPENIVYELRDNFRKNYLKKINESHILTEKNFKIFEKKFAVDCAFFELRFYRTICNAIKDRDPKKDRNIKLKLLRSWIKRNSALELSGLQDLNPQSLQKGLLLAPKRGRAPEKPLGFIKSAAKGSHKSYLQLLSEHLSTRGIAIILGMGGMGKTSLAKAYAHKVLDYDLIYWLPSETEFSLLKGYKNLLEEIGVSIKGLDDPAIIKLIKGHLPKQGKCLLIYDNVPNSTFLKGKTPEKAHLVITTRSASQWDYPPLNLEGFRRADSIKYFFKITGLQKNSENESRINELAEELADFPLALAHAGHYIRLEEGKNVSANSFTQYLNNFRTAPQLYFEDHQDPFKKESSAMTYENLIAKTFKISSENISELARKILGYCAYLDPNNVPEEIFRGEAASKEEVEEALTELSALSLIKRIQNGYCSIHRLLQMVMRNEDKSMSITQKTSQCFLDLTDLMIKRFMKIIEEFDKTKEWCSIVSSYLPHLVKAIEHANFLKLPTQKINSLTWLGLFAEHLDKTCGSSLKREKRGIRKKLLRPESIIPQGHILENQKSLLQLEPIPDWLVQSAEKNNTPYVPRTLGYIYHYCISPQDYETARLWYSKAAKYAGNQDIMNEVRHLMADAYEQDERNAEAIQYYRYLAAQGNIVAQEDLARLLLAEGEMGEAFQWYRYLAEQGNIVAQEDLADLLWQQEEIDEAIQWFLMPAEQGSVYAQTSLGDIYRERGEMDEAIQWFLMSAEQGDEYAQTSLGNIYREQGKVDQAIKWFMEAAKQNEPHAWRCLEKIYKKSYLEIWDKCINAFQNYGAGQHWHPQLFSWRDKLAGCYKARAEQGSKKALFLLGQLLESFGEAQDRNALGWSPKAFPCFAEAETWYKKSAEQGYDLAFSNLAAMYLNGKIAGSMPSNWDEMPMEVEKDQ